MYIFQDLPVNTQNAKIKSLTPIHIKLHGSGTCPWYDTILMREKSENIAHFCLLFPVECSESIGPGPQSRGGRMRGCTASGGPSQAAQHPARTSPLIITIRCSSRQNQVIQN